MRSVEAHRRRAAALLEFAADPPIGKGGPCHDLSTVRAICDEVMILYAGQAVEYGNRSALLTMPRHPYTDLLIASVPELRPGWLDGIARRDLTEAPGVLSGRDGLPCAFINRCGMRLGGVCETRPPPVRRLSKGSTIRCHRTAEDLLLAQAGVATAPISPSCARVD